MKYLSFLAVTTLFIACNTSDYKDDMAVPAKHEAPDNHEQKMAEPQTKTLTGCYSYTRNRDTIWMNIVQDGNKIAGSLVYNIFEKDRNNGKITGDIMGDTILVNYTFNSEGMSSVRQLIFLHTANTLQEGYGEMEDKNNRMQFKQPAMIGFKGPVLQSVACP